MHIHLTVSDCQQSYCRFQGRRKWGGWGGLSRPTFHTNFFCRRLNFHVPQHHASLAHSVQVSRGPRHYEVAVCLISACMEFFLRNVSAASLPLKNKSQIFSCATLGRYAASDITPDGRSTHRDLPTGLGFKMFSTKQYAANG